jgi:hypothetical protein
VTRAIQAILAPVVMVSACAILLSGLLNHYDAINTRLCALAGERRGLLRAPDGAIAPAVETSAFAMERLEEIDHQLPALLRRHRLQRDAVLWLYCATAVFILDMFVIALAAAAEHRWTSTLALAVFLVGTAAMLCGLIQTVREVRHSNEAAEYDARRAAALGS